MTSAAVALLVALASAARAPAAPAGTAAPTAAAADLDADVAATDAPEVPRVASVALDLPPGQDRAALAGLVALAPGRPMRARDLRRTVQLLFQTGRFRNVVVRAVPAAPPAGERGAWVAVEVRCLPVRILEAADVRLEGPAPGVDAERLRLAAGLRPGEPFDAPDLEAATARLRAEMARRGYRAATVEASSRGDADVELALRVRAGPPTRVRRVELAGDAGPEAARALASLRTRPGEILDEDALADDARRLRAALWDAGRRRARVGAPVVRDADGGVAVAFPVEAGPRVAIAFRGAAAAPADALSRELGLERGAPVDAPAIAAAGDRLVAWYRARGYADAQVEPEERDAPGAVAIVFHVDEGRRYRIGAVRLEGLAAHDAGAERARLLDLLDAEAGAEPDRGAADRARLVAASIGAVRPPPEPPEPLPPRERWDESSWDRAGERLAEAWRGEGWLDAAYLGVRVALDARRGVADVTLRFVEGSLVRVESIAFEGNAAIPLPALAREARLAPGDPLSWEKVEATRLAILRLYGARGYLYARVEHVVDRAHRAAIRYVVDEGPRVRIGRIVVTGNRRTREDVVRGALGLSEGDVYDPDAAARGQAALLRLGVFRSVGLRLRDPEVPQETKDLAVELSERPWQTLTAGAGFSIANGPRAVVEYQRPNVLGRALELTARGKVNYPLDTFRPDLAGRSPAGHVEGRAEVGLRQPRLEYLPVPVSGQTDAIVERLHRRAYDLGRVSWILGADAAVTSRFGVSLQYEAEVDQIDKTQSTDAITQADLERLRFGDGVTTLHALRPSFTLDYRDSSAHPRRGWFASGTAEWAHSIGKGGERYVLGAVPGSDYHVNMLKLSGTANEYLPIGRGSVLALSLRGGRVFPLDRDSVTIVPKRFFLGGATTMRGYAEEEMLEEDLRSEIAAEARACASSLSGLACTDRGRQVVSGKIPVSEGGEAFLLVKAELRVQLRGALEAGLFLDLGNLWLDPAHLSVLGLRTNAGIGLRFVTPIGPAALDLGFNLTPDRTLNERLFAPYFTIGLF